MVSLSKKAFSKKSARTGLRRPGNYVPLCPVVEFVPVPPNILPAELPVCGRKLAARRLLDAAAPALPVVPEGRVPMLTEPLEPPV
jgi:hypothetical protein